MPTADLEEAIAEYYATLSAVVAGDAEPLVQLYSRADDVTLANPWGPPVRGWAQVRDAVTAAATHFRDGGGTTERLTAVTAAGLAYIVEIERFQAKVDGARQHRPVTLRATTVFRWEDGVWRVVHRHADPVTAVPAPGSELG
jgi:ketosteroid isomerase-like protein